MLLDWFHSLHGSFACCWGCTAPALSSSMGFEQQHGLGCKASLIRLSGHEAVCDMQADTIMEPATDDQHRLMLSKVFDLLFPGEELAVATAGALAQKLHHLAVQADHLAAGEAGSHTRRHKKRKAGAANGTSSAAEHRTGS